TLCELLAETDLLIISDYLYESVKPALFTRIKEKFPDMITIIDSRNNLSEFRKVTYATPNEPEIKKMFPGAYFRGEEDFYRAGSELLNIIEAEGIILKRGYKGMIVFEKNKEPETIAIHGSSDIVDGAGAGDTVISVAGLALAAGADLPSSARLANIAGGIVVMKEGAYPISLNELQHELK
ncbi:MAG: PfkB family carbohydrate kinase, partial [Candidatus Aminicenantes bacterium]|nr:PfkB family carbohydrate kinase [Candidatus Aminicenantes bacterium]